MDWALIVFSFWHTATCLIGITVNILLIYLCLYKSPKSIQVYGIFIINFAITDFVECVFDIFVEFRIIPIPMEAKLLYQFNGLCQITGWLSCQYGLSILLHCLCHGLWSLLLSFSYRLYILTHSGLTRKHLIITILIVYIPSFVQLVTFPHNLVDDEKTIELIHEKLPTYDLTGLLISRLDIFESPSALFTVAHICVPIYPVYIIIFILRRKIVKILMVNEKMLSKETKAVHAQMLKCLTYQSLIPIFLFFAVCLYLLAQFGIVNNRWIEFGVITAYIPMPVLSSLTYICFVRPYREYCKRVFWNNTPDTTGIGSTKETKFNSTVTKMESTKPPASTIQY